MWKRVGKNGNKYWGSKGAGVFYTDGSKVLLLKRAEKGDAEGTWGLPGGKVEEGETNIDAAVRESIEECGSSKGRRFDDLLEKDGQHEWTTFFFQIDKPFDCKLSNEHSDWKWFDLNKLNKINLHPKLKENLDRHLKVVNKKFKKLNFKEWLQTSFVSINPPSTL
jgi:8-oxo-dGTP diphosphatase